MHSCGGSDKEWAAKYSTEDRRTARAPKLVCVDEHLGGKLQVTLAREDVRDDEGLQHDLGAVECFTSEYLGEHLPVELIEALLERSGNEGILTVGAAQHEAYGVSRGGADGKEGK